MLVAARLRARKDARTFERREQVDLSPWTLVVPVAVTLLPLVAAMYLVFSPLGVAGDGPGWPFATGIAALLAVNLAAPDPRGPAARSADILSAAQRRSRDAADGSGRRREGCHLLLQVMPASAGPSQNARPASSGGQCTDRLTFARCAFGEVPGVGTSASARPSVRAASDPRP